MARSSSTRSPAITRRTRNRCRPSITATSTVSTSRSRRCAAPSSRTWADSTVRPTCAAGSGARGQTPASVADVPAGALTHEEAKERRRIEQEETTFFGSLDGASKFVKGDAIAGLLITLLNLVAGLAIGIGVHGLSFSAAIETYSMLTVGDGLVSQIPSVITSIAAAHLLAKGGVPGSADAAANHPLGA